MSERSLDEEVLLRIAQGSNTFYTLTVKEKVGSNDGVLEALERLLNNRLIKMGPKGPRNSQPYLLTEDGFDYVLRFIDDIRDVDIFVRAGVEYFPLVFKYWKSLGEYDLHGWVLDTLRLQIPRIDIMIYGQLLMGDRERFSHTEFIDLLYSGIYGPWLAEGEWENFIERIPVDRIAAFLHGNPEIMRSRDLEYDNNVKRIDVIRHNNESYRREVLENIDDINAPV